jgi:Bacterial Ig-like domain (group 2)
MRSRSFLGALSCLSVLFVSCSGGVNKTPVTVSISPTTVSVPVGMTQQFTATATGTSNSAVTWSVAGGPSNGSITSTGLYTAPGTVPTPPAVTVTATSQADATKSASATVTVTATTSSGSVTVSPSAATVSDFGTQQFTASVNGVAWQVDGIAGGNQTVGFISATGLYVAPSGVPTKSNGKGNSVTTTVTVSAVASSGAGTATVTIMPANQTAQSGPVELGASGGNASDSTTNTSAHTITCCGGTLGSLVTRGGTQYILSNTHILAPLDSQPADTSVIQPGLIDTSTCTPSGAKTVANLTAFYNLENGVPPKIDAAIAQVIPGQVDPAGNILYLGATLDANGVPVPGAPHAGSGVTASLAMPVAKSGRSTGLTCSTVLGVSVNVNAVQYQKGCGTGATFTVNYTNQVDISGGSFSAEGDSGSLIVSQDSADPVALLYAGSDTDTVGNPVAAVLNFFASGGNNVTFVGDTSAAGHQVIGCTLPVKPSAASTAQAAATVAPEAMQKAAAVRDAHAPELLAHPEVQAVGVGTSRDNPREPAILFFVTAGQPRTNIPAQVDGMRTRIVEGPLFAKRGSLSAEESAQLVRSAGAALDVYPISDAELARAKTVHEAHAHEVMTQPGVQGVGISSSLDAPGEAALLIFLVRGEAHNPIPPVIDGLRTRMRESSRFRAGSGDSNRRGACTIPASKTSARKPMSTN